MEEKILMESKRGSITKIVCLSIVLLGILAFSIVWTSETSAGFYYDRIADGDWDYVFTSMVPYFGSMTLLPALVISAILFFGTARCSMTITNKRVYGKTAFGKRVDLPLDSISAVGTGILRGLTTATSSGKIVFYDIANREQMHECISKLLIERQEKNAGSAAVKQDPTQTTADELRKYKELLDSGVITQEEFDAKKKQLLGL